MRERTRSINNTTDFLITPIMYAPLETSLVLRKGTGDPTWSRATKAWGFNELGYLRELASGSAFFGGARLVRNLVAASEDVSGAAWSKSNCTAPTANSVVCANATNLQRFYAGSYTAVAGQVIFHRARFSYVDIQFVQIRSSGSHSNGCANFDLINGTSKTLGAASAAGVIQISPGVYDCWVKINIQTSAAASLVLISFVSSLDSTFDATFVGDGIKSVDVTRLFSCDVTGYDASYVPEYVSVGVEASPYFGAGIDGAKYFSTDYTGGHALTNLIGFRREAAATNNLMWNRDFVGQSWSETGGNFTPGAWIPSVTGSSLVTNGDFASDLSGWTNNGASTNTWSGGNANIDGTGGTGGIYQELTTTIGKTYLITVAMTAISGSGNAVVAIKGATVGSTTIRYDGAAVSKNISIIFKATLASHVLYAYSSAGRVAQFDDVVVKECTCVPERTATGLDGIANTATTLTATEADAIILQPTSGIASADRCASAYVKRRTGTGTISFTQDGGSTWTDITSQINGSTWSRVQITSTLANPSVGFKISTIGDAIDVDCVQNEAGTVATSPIVTTTTAVTRNVDSLTYQTSGNWSNTVGTAYVEVEPLAYSGGAIGSATNGLLLSTSNSGATAFDGTNAANGPTGTPGTSEKLALNWTGAVMEVASSATVGTPGTYDGAMGLSNIGIGVGASGYFKNVAVYPYALSDADMVKITT